MVLDNFQVEQSRVLYVVVNYVPPFSTAFAQDAFTSVSHASIIFLVFFNIGFIYFSLS